MCACFTTDLFTTKKRVLERSVIICDTHIYLTHTVRLAALLCITCKLAGQLPLNSALTRERYLRQMFPSTSLDCLTVFMK